MARYYALLIVGILATLSYSQLPQTLPICWRDAYGRGVGTIPRTCANGSEVDAGLCYPECKDGFYGVGPVCWQSCLPGMHDGGVFCYGGGHSEYTKKSYGRGVGQIPHCDEYTHHEKDAGLCYPECETVYEGIGPVCWYNGSGNSTFTVPCQWLGFATYAYGANTEACSQVEQILRAAGFSTWICIVDLIQTIMHEQLNEMTTCQVAVDNVLTKIFPGFLLIRPCSEPPFTLPPFLHPTDEPFELPTIPSAASILTSPLVSVCLSLLAASSLIAFLHRRY